MKYLLLWLVMLILKESVLGQKKDLDTAALHNWPSAENGGLSPNGKYAYYHIVIENPYLGIRNTLVIKSIETNWSIRIENAEVIDFSIHKSQIILIQLTGDTIAKLELQTRRIKYWVGIKDWQYFKDWIVYRQKGNDSLFVENVESGKNFSLAKVQDFFISRKNGLLIVQQKMDSIHWNMQWIDFATYSKHTIYIGDHISQWIWDQKERQLALAAGENTHKCIFIYKVREKAAKKLLSDSTITISSSDHIQDISRFTINGKYLLFNITKDIKQASVEKDTSISIYSYKDLDPVFGNNHLDMPEQAPLRSIDLSTGRLLTITHEDENATVDNGEYILVEYHKKGYEWERYLSATISRHLIRLKDGKKIEFSAGNDFWFSPSGKWMLYFDPEKDAYLTFALISGLKDSLIFKDEGQRWLVKVEPGDPWRASLGVEAWGNGGDAAIIRARDGLWELDLTGRSLPIHLTVNGRGHDSIIYTIAVPKLDLKDGDSITLVGFNPYTKENGFYRCVLGRSMLPVTLNKGPWAFWIPFVEGMPPIRAENVNLFLVRRMTAESSPDFMVTADFRRFRTISDVHPERQYNWLTTELVHWTSYDGTPLSGVLYKPEKMDSSTKYPLLLYYYEQLSDNFHVFLKPATAHGPLNIPYMVSKGFLVFTPDIEYTIGSPGKNACDAVVSAARFLSQRSYVDSLHMGIQGHSWGGFETNYIITHTNLFAAACSASGVSDMLMDYSGIRGDRFNQMFVEHGQSRMGGSPWQVKARFMESSPLLDVDKITTPLLIMHNLDDGAVNVRQSIALFGAMRRLSKPCWLLQYKGEDHILFNKANRLDYTQKIIDFFSYYLKGDLSLVPAWLK